MECVEENKSDFPMLQLNGMCPDTTYHPWSLAEKPNVESIARLQEKFPMTLVPAVTHL